MPEGELVCRRCDRSFEVVSFSPMERMIEVLRQEQVGPSRSTPCANHERNIATAACERCGHFICGLCKIESDGKVLCSNCFGRMAEDGGLDSAITSVRNYTGSSALCVLGSFLTWPAGVFLGPLAVFFGIKALKQKKKLGPDGGRIGTWIAMVFGVLVFFGSIALLAKE